MQYAKLQNRLNKKPMIPRPETAGPETAGQAKPAQQQVHPQEISAPDPAPLLQLLCQFAARMQGRVLHEISLPPQFEMKGAALSREVLSSAAHELGLTISFQTKDLNRLKETDFPCLLALANGSAFCAVGLQNDNILLVEDAGKVQPLSLASLAEQYSGTTLFLRAKLPEKSIAQSQTPPHETPATGAPKNKLVRDLFKFMTTHAKARLMQLALAAMLSNLLLVVLPLFIMSVYDRIIPHLAMETLWALAIGVIIALLVDFGLRTVRSTLLESVAILASNHFQGRFYARLMRVQMAEMPRTAGGLSGAIAEFEHLCRIVPQTLIALTIDLPFFLLMLALLAYMGGAVVIAPIIGIVVIAIAHIVSYARSRNINAASVNLSWLRTNQMIETLGAIETIKATNAQNQLLSKWEQRLDAGAYLGFLARHQTGFASHIAIITVQMTIVLTLIIGVYELQAGGITMGALAASTLLVGRAMAPMGNLVSLFVRGFHIQRSSGALEHILETPLEAAGDRQKNYESIFKGQLDLNNVSFRYQENGPTVLQNISLSLKPGERVGLIGRIGCGKSTLLQLMPRLYDASEGTALLDGHDLRQYDPNFLRQNMGLMPQDPVLMEGSLRDNICFGLGEIDEPLFEQVVALTGVRDFASKHPQGYGMPVGPRGETLSGGERATVVLARTLLRQPKMLLLDEPTAAMDNEMENRIVRNLAGWIGDRSLIIATHRAPALALVDRIIWLNNGQIVADGPRDEILKKLKG